MTNLSLRKNDFNYLRKNDFNYLTVFTPAIKIVE